MLEFNLINEDTDIYKVSEMAASSFKDENHSMTLAISLEFEAMKRALEFETSLLLGAFSNQICVGFIWSKFEVQNKEVKIYNLFVEEAYRRQGIATKLKQEAEKWASQIGAHTIVSTVHANNQQMIDINKSMDYEIEKVIMRKKLF
ncbi:GNAT family N-acetyltransferase [Mammaliicoccus sp. Dog046]|uniref:GNAT family N-acetyltransferase n=1 Tax=Mammaliicoccus sp. Dog046 TaxID=3034233 RepID=UPI002B26340F|nr:GNAT family N-acetyltransferase [Mammaliicoccus sp. Dog046]WQK85080.1 GNAT family N-acetyltransferase [Mammaliicoccus sp. Dog046]